MLNIKWSRGPSLRAGTADGGRTPDSALLDRIRGRLEQLSALDENLDRAGAQVIEVDALIKAFEIAYAICERYPNLAEPQVTPLASGGVQLEWHALDADLEIEVGPEGQLSVYFDGLKTPERSWVSSPASDRTEVIKGLQEFIALTLS